MRPDTLVQDRTLQAQLFSLATHGGSLHSGHVWAGAGLQEHFLHEAGLVGCGHVSGLLMRHGWPLALMLCADQVPIQSTAFGDALTQAGSPDPRNDRVCITSLCPRQFPMTLHAANSYAAGNNFGS